MSMMRTVYLPVISAKPLSADAMLGLRHRFNRDSYSRFVYASVDAITKEFAGEAGFQGFVETRLPARELSFGENAKCRYSQAITLSSDFSFTAVNAPHEPVITSPTISLNM